MTYEQLFSGRLLLQQAQKHLANRAITYISPDLPKPAHALPVYHENRIAFYAQFQTAADLSAYFILDRCLRQLEEEFEGKRKAKQNKRAA